MEGCVNFLSLYQVDVLVVHHPCSDGSGAEWAICWHRRPQFILGADYSEDSCQRILQVLSDQTNKLNVLFVDVCLPSEMMVRVCQAASKVMVLDHHLTGQENMSKLLISPAAPKNLHCHFDLSHSGAVLAWDYAQASLYEPSKRQESPEWLRFIEDRDLWRWSLIPASRYFTCTLYAAPVPTPGTASPEWDHFQLDPEEVPRAITSGEKLWGPMQRLIDEQLSRAQDQWIRLDEKLARICLIEQLPGEDDPQVFPLVSDIGHQAVTSTTIKPCRDVCIIWSRSSSKCRYSFRSWANSRITALQLAESLGGGGHVHAAGLLHSESPETLLAPLIVHQVPKLADQLYLFATRSGKLFPLTE